MSIDTWITNHVFKPVKNAFKNAFGIAQNQSKKFMKWAGDCIDGILKGLKNTVGKVLNWFKNLPSSILSAIGNITERFKKKGSEFITSIKTGAVEKWETVKSWFSNLPSNIGKQLSSIKDIAKEKGLDFIDGLKEGITLEKIKKATVYRDWETDRKSVV